MRVFVADGDQRPALAVTRSLGRRGIDVLVGEEKERSLASSSKHCVGHVTYPSPYRHPEEFSSFLLKFTQQTQLDLIMPITDVTTYLVASHKELLDYTRVSIPTFEAFDFVSDKAALLKHAQKIGIPVPQTYFIERPDDLADVLVEIEYPVVVKPARSRVLTERGWLATHVAYANSATELTSLYRQQSYLQHPSLIQERIIGPGVGLFLLLHHGDPVAAFCHKRLREKPPSDGVSVLRESIPLDPALKAHAMRLFKPLGWNGVVMMEYKLDQRTGQALLMEVNGRFWGSLQLAIDAGVDFPYLLYQMAMEGPLHLQAPYQVGVQSRWLLGDLDHLLLRLFKKDQDLHLPPDYPSRTKTLIDFMHFWRPALYYEILSLQDPRPFLYELAEYLQGFFKGEKIAHG